MQAWIHDAQDLMQREDFEADPEALVLTPGLNDFLTTDSMASRALVAPKGFGKTLFLKMKRVRMERQNHRCLPRDHIVDRPAPSAPVLDQKTLTYLSEPSAWHALWQIVFTMCLYKNDRGGEHDWMIDAVHRRVNPKLAAIYEQQLVENPFEFMHEILRQGRRDIISFIAEAGDYVGLFQRYKPNTSIFVDNIDEYMDPYISNGKYFTGQPGLGARVWNAAQVGAWQSLRSLHGVNSHVRLFISMRKEAMHHARGLEMLSHANLTQFALEIAYGSGRLGQVITTNIRREKGGNLVQRFTGNGVPAFFPRESHAINHARTGAAEPVLDYWIRHCIGRPRDIVRIGKGLSEILPEARTRAAVRADINKTAAILVDELLNEIRPHVPGFHKEFLIEVLRTNTYSSAEIAAVQAAYESLVATRRPQDDETGGEDEEDPVGANGYGAPPQIFEVLHAAGLLGVVRVEDAGDHALIQSFADFGEHPLREPPPLPNAPVFVVHPALSDVIANHDQTYLERINRHNIVGHGLPWHAEEDYVFVIVGDIRNWSEAVSRKPGPAGTFSPYWRKTFDAATHHLADKQLKSGDAFRIADHSAGKLLTALNVIAQELRKSRYALKIRAGGHSEFWDLKRERPDLESTSDAIVTAERVQQKAEPGSLWVTEQFYRGIGSAELMDRFREGELVDIGKSHEQGLKTTAYSLNLCTEFDDD